MEPALPIAVILPLAIMMLWSGLGSAPVPSITRTCSSAINGALARRKGCAGSATPIATEDRRLAIPSKHLAQPFSNASRAEALAKCSCVKTSFVLQTG
jgi:hypothetical protein